MKKHEIIITFSHGAETEIYNGFIGFVRMHDLLSEGFPIRNIFRDAETHTLCVLFGSKGSVIV